MEGCCVTDRAIELLTELGLISDDEDATSESLTGGVSSDIVRVHSDRADYCVKFALPQLKVKDVWTAPLDRNASEYAWLTYVAGVAPHNVPKLLGRSERLGGFAMVYLDPAAHPNWKTEMLAGRVKPGFAAEVGHVLGMIHAHAAGDEGGRRRFDRHGNFFALRLDPYLLTAGQRNSDLAGALGALVDELAGARISLVHGDVSPKNILMGPQGPIILDAECAVEGDPAFDVAFCLNHLVIKTLAGVASRNGLAAEATGFWDAYRSRVDWEDAETLEARVVRVVAGLMLARVDGKSPVEYLGERDRKRLRGVARMLIDSPPSRIADVLVEVLRAAEVPA
jgi:aminoglycoside phosphotransferase (APT) family kinase protein